MPGELVLKRDVGGGKREEIFVPRAQLARDVQPAAAGVPKLFEDMGLARETTQPGATSATREPQTLSDVPTVVVEPPAAQPARTKPESLPPLPPGAGPKPAN